MKKYRLKQQARQFFKEDYCRKIMTLPFWETANIHPNLLEEVEPIYIKYGQKSGENSENLSGWSSNDGSPEAHFNFTIYANQMSHKNYENFPVSDLMSEIQEVVNKFFSPYVEVEN